MVKRLILAVFVTYSTGMVFSQKEASVFVEAENFKAADSCLTAVSADPVLLFYAFTFIYNQAEDNTPAALRFFEYESEQNGKLKNLFQFYDAYLKLTHQKMVAADFFGIAEQISSGHNEDVYSYLSWLSAIHVAERANEPEKIKTALTVFNTSWNSFLASENISNQSFFARDFIAYLKIAMKYGIETEDQLLAITFSSDHQSKAFMIPNFELVWGQPTVFDDKYAILKKRTHSPDKQAENIVLLAKAVCETPSKKHLNMAKKLVPKSIDFQNVLKQEFNEGHTSLPLSDSLQHYLNTVSQDGNWLIVDFWGTWCGPCKKELPEWKEFMETHYDYNCSMALISFNSQQPNEFLLKQGISFPNKEATKAEIQQLGINQFPTTVLISPEGKAAYLGSRDKQEYISVFISKK